MQSQRGAVALKLYLLVALVGGMVVLSGPRPEPASVVAGPAAKTGPTRRRRVDSYRNHNDKGHSTGPAVSTASECDALGLSVRPYAGIGINTANESPVISKLGSNRPARTVGRFSNGRRDNNVPRRNRRLHVELNATRGA